MINAHISNDAAVPWWAAFGAPLLGVPLLVAILAVGAPRDPDVESMQEPEAASYVTEPVDRAPQDVTVDLPAEHSEHAGISRS